MTNVVPQVSSMGITPFFVENVSELQLAAIKMVTTVTSVFHLFFPYYCFCHFISFISYVFVFFLIVSILWHHRMGLNTIAEALTRDPVFLPCTHEMKSGVKQLVNCCLSCLQTSFFDRRTTAFQFNVIFWTRNGTWIGKRTCSLAERWLWICPARACAERSKIIFLLCLPVWLWNKI